MVVELEQWQQDLEGQLLALLDRPIRADQTMTEVFGPFERWQCTVRGVELWLSPVERRWWYLDAVAGTWERVPHRAGEVRFAEVEGELEVVALRESDDPDRWARFQEWDAKIADLRAQAVGAGMADAPPAAAPGRTAGSERSASPSSPPPPPPPPRPGATDVGGRT